MNSGREPFDLDKVSLECFTNQHQYKKYLAKKESATQVHNTQSVLQERAISKSESLIKLFEELIHNTEHQKYYLLDSKYIPFMEACLDHLEKRERQQNIEEARPFETPSTVETPVATIPIEYWKMHKIVKD